MSTTLTPFLAKFVGFDITENLNKKASLLALANPDTPTTADLVLFEPSFGVLPPFQDKQTPAAALE